MVFTREEWLKKGIRLPPLAEQRRIVAVVDGLASEIAEAHLLRQQAAREAEALLYSLLRSEQQRIVSEIDALQAQVDALKRLQAETAAELDALMPAILDRAFKGEL